MGERVRKFRERIFPALTGPGYGSATRLLWETSRPLSLIVAGYAVAASVLPNLVLIAAGRLVGDIPAAAHSGLRSQAGRVALARALFAVRHGAKILVLDEPTAWLDARGEADFFDRFLDITAGTTTVIISHRFSTVRRADHICVLDGGQVLEQGSHESLVAAGNRYAQLFGLQAARFGEAAE